MKESGNDESGSERKISTTHNNAKTRKCIAIYIYIYMRGWMIKYFSCVEGKWLPVSPVAGDIVCDTAASAGRNTTVTAVLRERGLHVLNVFFAQLDPTPIPFRIRRVY